MSKSCSELNNQISESVAFNISSKQEYRKKKVHYLTKNLKLAVGICKNEFGACDLPPEGPFQGRGGEMLTFWRRSYNFDIFCAGQSSK